MYSSLLPVARERAPPLHERKAGGGLRHQKSEEADIDRGTITGLVSLAAKAIDALAGEVNDRLTAIDAELYLREDWLLEPLRLRECRRPFGDQPRLDDAELFQEPQHRRRALLRLLEL